jgi:translation initiation factor RLI1
MTGPIPKDRDLLDDSRRLQFGHERLVEQCQAFLPGEYARYQSFDFVEGTGYMRTVADEIDFVLGGYDRTGDGTVAFDDFVTRWDLERYLDRDIRHLSGGWKKLLGLGLFTARRSEGKVYVDACRQLSDRLIRLVVENVTAENTGRAFFFDYDAALLDDLGLEDVWAGPEGIASIPPGGSPPDAGQESNYVTPRN